MEDTQAHNLDGKFSPKGPWKFFSSFFTRNTYLAENSEEQ